VAIEASHTRVAGTGDSDAQEQLRALMAISAAVLEGREVSDTLAEISQTAAQLLGAAAAAVILRVDESETGLSVAGSFGLSERYLSYLNEIQPIEVGKGASGLAVQEGRAVIVVDVLEDPIFEPWRAIAVSEHYRSLVSVPLRGADGPPVGVLNTYRAEAGAWTTREVALLSLLADHAAIAIRTARLLDDSRRQVMALSLMVRSLRAQTHEHSNRMHAIYGLLSMGQVDDARRLIAAVEDSYHSTYASVTTRIHSPVLAGFLVAEAAIARQSGITMTLDRQSRLDELPAGLDELDAVTVIGNLIQNAVEAVSDMPPSRRRLSIRISRDKGTTLFRVRDWGPGVPAEAAERMFDRDFTTKPEHAGVGLALVRSIVNRVRGAIEVEHPRGGGLVVSVTVPG
jgi:signal transduction histidine kinase